jgi:hypothetical protein
VIGLVMAAGGTAGGTVYQFNTDRDSLWMGDGGGHRRSGGSEGGGPAETRGDFVNSLDRNY